MSRLGSLSWYLFVLAVVLLLPLVGCGADESVGEDPATEEDCTPAITGGVSSVTVVASSVLSNGSVSGSVEVTVAVRPEDIMVLEDSADPANTFEVRVEEMEFLGSFFRAEAPDGSDRDLIDDAIESGELQQSDAVLVEHVDGDTVHWRPRDSFGNPADDPGDGFAQVQVGGEGRVDEGFQYGVFVHRPPALGFPDFANRVGDCARQKRSPTPAQMSAHLQRRAQDARNPRTTRHR